MGVFSIDYGNHGAKIIAAFCKAYNYQDEVDDPENPGQMIANPVTKAQFTKNIILSFIRETVTVNSEAIADAKAAHEAALVAERQVQDTFTIE